MEIYLARKQACSPLNIFCSYVSLLKSKADYDISQKLATLTKKRSLRSLSQKIVDLQTLFTTNLSNSTSTKHSKIKT